MYLYFNIYIRNVNENNTYICMYIVYIANWHLNNNHDIKHLQCEQIKVCPSDDYYMFY